MAKTHQQILFNFYGKVKKITTLNKFNILQKVHLMQLIKYIYQVYQQRTKLTYIHFLNNIKKKTN